MEDNDGGYRQRLKDKQPLEAIVGELLQQAGATICTAESCSGGLLAHRLTNIAGSSAYFTRGWVTYSNEAKVAELGVPAELINRYGAVSAEVAGAMATGALAVAGATYALAISGIAGPGGGSAHKPVGLVYMALAGPAGYLRIAREVFGGARLAIKEQSTTYALTMLLDLLQSIACGN